MRIVFMGTSDFAVPCLKTLIDNKYDICSVITQPDRPKGRGKKLAPPPIKELAQSAGLLVHQPERVKRPEFVEVLKEISPDLIVVVDFGQIISKAILDIPALGCINVHGSILPKYRGAAPINWCIINGEKTTGVTTMYMDEGVDTGDMIIKKEIEIDSEETAEALHDRLAILGAEALMETIRLIQSGNAPRVPQNNEESSHAPMLSKALGKIDWSNNVETIKNLIRGTYPWPSAYTSYNEKTFKIYNAEIDDAYIQNTRYGYIEKVNKDSILVSCGVGKIKIKEVQFENEKRMSVEAYLRGHNILEGIKLL